MTAIVGIIEEGVIYMGADSAGANSEYIGTRKDAKIFKNDSFIIGYTSSFRMGQLLRFSFKPPHHKVEIDVYEYMCTGFIESVRRCLKDGGYTTISDSSEVGGEFLVGYKNRLFHIYSDFQVAESVYEYDACGCGEAISLGSLYTSKNLIEDPKERIYLALKAAQEFSVGVRGPFTIITSLEDTKC